MEFYPICDETLALTPNLWYSVSGFGECPFMRVGHTVAHHSKSEQERGSLLVIGGANPSECFKDIYNLNLSTLAWTKFEDSKNFNTGRYEHACFQSKDKDVYIFGGADQEKNYNDVIKFNISDKTCEKLISESLNVPSPRTMHCAVTFKDQLLVFGGGEAGKEPVSDDRVYIYNPMNKKWIALSIKGESPKLRHGHVMINQNDKFIFMYGGMNAEGIFDDMWRLDLMKMLWNRIEFKQDGVRPCGRAAHGGILIDEKLFIFGGIGDSGTALDDLWKYNIDTNEWSKIEVYGHPPPARLDFAYCKLSFVNKINESKPSQATEETSDSSDLINLKKIQELNLGDFGNQCDIPEEDDEEANDSFSKKGTIKPKEEKISIETKAEEKSNEIKAENTENVISKICNYLVIHGGMDTEGNVHEDMFLISPE